MSARLLVLDAASPVVSLAVAEATPDGVTVLGERSVEIRRSSRFLVGLLDEALGDAGWKPRDLTHLVALRGPGSFTGLRVGLSTIYGLHQALGVAATAVSNLDGLAAAAFEDLSLGRVVAAVDVLRGEWVAQVFVRDPAGGGVPVTEPERLAAAELSRLATRPGDDQPGRDGDGGAAVLTGFPLGPAEAVAALGLPLLTPPPLAPAVARRVGALLHRDDAPLAWDPSLLTRPLYFRAPAVSRPKKRRRPGPTGGRPEDRD